MAGGAGACPPLGPFGSDFGPRLSLLEFLRCSAAEEIHPAIRTSPQGQETKNRVRAHVFEMGKDASGRISLRSAIMADNERDGSNKIIAPSGIIRTASPRAGSIAFSWSRGPCFASCGKEL